jgi:hypothetical protein
MSNSSPEPEISVVIGSKGPATALEACLGALEPQRDGAEVLVCESDASPPELRDRFRWAAFVERRGKLVPELWTEGIDRSRGRVVALTISSMVPAPDWIETIRDQLARRDAVAGAIDPGEGLRVSDWAEYFCRYIRDMLPFEGHECLEIPGDNCAYKRELLERTRSLYRDGFWEPVVNRQLAADGVVLWHEPELVVRQGRSAGVRAFWSQRLVHGRAHGRQRGERFSRARNAIGVLAWPAVPVLLTVRILRNVFARRRHRIPALRSLPLVLLFNLAWAAGEALGHVDSLRRR